MARHAAPKKPVLVRLPVPTYNALLAKSSEEGVARGQPVSIQVLIVEGIDEWLKSEKEEK